MSFKNIVGKMTNALINPLGFRVVRHKNQLDEWDSQKWLIGRNDNNLIVFDVGAFDGDTALVYSRLFPNSTIYAFEPFQESYDLLQANTSHLQNVKCFQMGIGKGSGQASFMSNKYSQSNSLLETDERASNMWGNNISTDKKIKVQVTSIDDFVRSESINNINVLKLDVQGAEYDAFLGAHEMLKNKRIDLIYTEILNVPTYKGQKDLHEVIDLLRSYDYHLYNLYAFERNNNGQLRQLDAIFINDKVKKEREL